MSRHTESYAMALRSVARENGISGKEMNSTLKMNGKDVNAKQIQTEDASRNQIQKNIQPSHFPWSSRSISNTQDVLPRFGHSAVGVAVPQAKEKSNIPPPQAHIIVFGGCGPNSVKPTNDLIEIRKSPAPSSGLETSVIETIGYAPSKRKGHTATVVGTHMCVFGGEDIDGKCDEHLYMYNIIGHQWTKPFISGPLPLGRYGHCGAVIGTTWYIFGGCEDGYHLNDILCINLDDDDSQNLKWQFISPANEGPVGRKNMTMCAYGSKLYVFGGTDGEIFFNDVWSYDTETNHWSFETAAGYMPHAREGHAAVVVKDAMYVIGGRSARGREILELCAFRILNNRWYVFQNMGVGPAPRAEHSLVAIGSRVIVVGGDVPLGNAPGGTRMSRPCLNSTRPRFGIQWSAQHQRQCRQQHSLLEIYTPADHTTTTKPTQRHQQRKNPSIPKNRKWKTRLKKSGTMLST